MKNITHVSMFKDLSIRFKMMVGQTLLIAAVSVFIYTYYPSRQEQAAIQAIESKVFSIANMFSIGVGIGMGETDFVAVGEALEWSNTDSSVVYISVVNTSLQEIASYSKVKRVPNRVSEKRIGDKPVEIEGVIYYRTDIVYQGQVFGDMVIGYSLSNMRHSIDQLKLTTLLFCTGLFCFGALLAFLLSNMIAKNIRKLESTVSLISNGAEHVHVEVPGGDEVGKLALAFNNMLYRLEKSRKEQVRYSEQLKKQNDELNQFSYVVSHDLKAPLRAIFKLSEWIEEDLAGVMQDETKQNMETLRGRVFRLEALINGLLQYSKIGRVNTPVERVDVRKMVNECIELLNPPENIAIRIQDNLPVFETKKMLFQQVFINLISNAIKYNDKPQGLIEITAEEFDAHYCFSVRDNGIGIEKIYHEKIFEIFQTLNARDKVEATGVGLAIIKKCVEDMNGQIRVESEKGVGSTFTFTWPKQS